MFYSKELDALRSSLRYRERQLYSDKIVDLASNDYLGLAYNKEILARAIEHIDTSAPHSPAASMLINGYHKIHKEFEDELCAANGFESGVVVGSGFCANIALIETLVRRSDELFIDQSYHASGILASKLIGGKVSTFEHNNMRQLESFLKNSTAHRRIVAVEGVYSMGGDLVDKEVFELAQRYDAILIVDEAHSSGVVGDRLLGVFDLYNITPTHRHIKMGTLGKAYGSFGSYILSSAHINEYLINRAKPIIYATAPSLIQTAIALESLRYIGENLAPLRAKIDRRKAIAKEILGVEPDALILNIPQVDTDSAMKVKEKLLEEKILVAAIRPPTVPRSIVRMILRVAVKEQDISKACFSIASLDVSTDLCLSI